MAVGMGILPLVGLTESDHASVDVHRRVSAAHLGLGLAVRGLRREAGLSQGQLASRAGMHRTYVGGIERGERNVSFSNLTKLAEVLAIRPSELLALGESLEPPRG